MKILIASSIDPSTVEKLQQVYDVKCAFNVKDNELKEQLDDRQVLIFRSGVKITKSVLDSAPNLQLIIRAGSGLDNIDLECVAERNIRLERIPQPGALAVTEMTFALMLALSRNVVHGHALWKKGRWAKNELGGNLIYGKTLGIVGCGNIGSKVGEFAAAWGMRPIGCVKTPKPEKKKSLADKGIELLSFDEVISQGDIVSLHTPLNDTTRHFINSDVFAKMKTGSYLINIARGGVVDEQALYRALTVDKKLKGAALDVHEQEGEGKISPLAELANVILTPHIGAMALESQGQIGVRILELLQDFVKKTRYLQ